MEENTHNQQTSQQTNSTSSSRKPPRRRSQQGTQKKKPRGGSSYVPVHFHFGGQHASVMEDEAGGFVWTRSLDLHVPPTPPSPPSLPLRSRFFPLPRQPVAFCPSPVPLTASHLPSSAPDQGGVLAHVCHVSESGRRAEQPFRQSASCDSPMAALTRTRGSVLATAGVSRQQAPRSPRSSGLVWGGMVQSGTAQLGRDEAEGGGGGAPLSFPGFPVLHACPTPRLPPSQLSSPCRLVFYTYATPPSLTRPYPTARSRSAIRRSL